MHRFWQNSNFFNDRGFLILDDPCTISSQLEFMEAVKLTLELREPELKVHVFIGMPISPGAPCPGEDSKIKFSSSFRNFERQSYRDRVSQRSASMAEENLSCQRTYIWAKAAQPANGVCTMFRCDLGSWTCWIPLLRLRNVCAQKVP